MEYAYNDLPFMKTQQQINKTQEVVNDRQGTVNDSQGSINDQQTTINDKTKIDLSVRNFWAIIMLVVSVTSLYLYTQFSVTSDIKIIKTDVASIKVQNQLILERYISLENRYGDIALKVNKLETLSGIK